MNKFLTFIHGEPFIYDTQKKDYSKFDISADDCVNQIIKSNIPISFKKKSNIWDYFAKLNNLDGYNYHYNLGNANAESSFKMNVQGKLAKKFKWCSFCFINGIPHIYNKGNSSYERCDITVDEAIKSLYHLIVKINMSKSINSDLIQLIASFFNTDGYKICYNKGPIVKDSFLYCFLEEAKNIIYELNQKNAFCFVDGNPFIFSYNTREYIKINISVEEAFNIIKDNLLLPKVRPNMQTIWNILGNDLSTEGYRYQFNKNLNIVQNSFQNRLINKITCYLNEIYPPEINKQNLQKTHEYNRIKAQKQNAGCSCAAKRFEREILMKKKNGRKLY